MHGVRWLGALDARAVGGAIWISADEPVRFTGLIDRRHRAQACRRTASRIAQSAGGVGTFEYSDGFATAAVSDEFCRLLGLHPASFLPVRTINGLVCPGSPPLIPDMHRSRYETELLGEFEVARSNDGERRWIARRGEVVRDDEGASYRFIGVIYDVTAAKEAESQAPRSQRKPRTAGAGGNRRAACVPKRRCCQSQKMEAVGQLASGIAHDFNNLLTIITGNVETIGRRLDESGDPRIRRAIDNAMKGAERAAALTQRLLAFLAPAAAWSRSPPTSPRLIAGMSDLLKRSISETIAIQSACAEPGLWWCEVDQHQLENAVLNLVGQCARRDAGRRQACPSQARNIDPGWPWQATAR